MQHHRAVAAATLTDRAVTVRAVAQLGRRQVLAQQRQHLLKASAGLRCSLAHAFSAADQQGDLTVAVELEQHPHAQPLRRQQQGHRGVAPVQPGQLNTKRSRQVLGCLLLQHRLQRRALQLGFVAGHGNNSRTEDVPRVQEARP